MLAEQESSGISRRSLLSGAVGAVAGVGAASVTAYATSPREEEAVPQTVSPVGPHQAGINQPATPQTFGLLRVYNVGPDLMFLPAVGKVIRELCDTGADVLPDGPRRLTVTVGVGPDLVSSLGAEVPDVGPLPAFARDDQIDPLHHGGGLVIAAYADDPGVLATALTTIEQVIPEISLRWEQRGYRPPGEGTITRNPLEFHDGVIVPHTSEELERNVWLDGRFAGGTIMVVRRLRLDALEFSRLSLGERQRVIGRRIDGSPLSGGPPFAEVDLHAKTSAGEFLTPVNSHVRAAHPSFTGSELMLRRGYAYDNGNGDAGLLFICFQNRLRTFVRTQQRLDEIDALSAFSTPTGSGSFLVLPGLNNSSIWGGV